MATQKESGYTTVELPASYRTASIKQMTGVEEEIIVDPKLSRNAGKLITELLRSVVVELDGKKPSVDDIRKLSIGDRDYLLMELRKISLGDEMDMSFQCTACNSTQELMVNISDCEIKYGDKEANGEMPVELIDGWKDQEGVVHKEVTAKFPDGFTQERTAAVMRQNVARGNTEMLTLSIIRIGEDIKATSAMVRNFTKRDRDVLVKNISRDAPGPKLMTMVDCMDCGANFETMLDLSNFFVLT